MKITIIGAGNIGGAIARGLAKGQMFDASDITCTAHTEATLKKIRTLCPGIVTTTSNPEAVLGADIIVLAVKPWLVEAIAGEIKDSLSPNQLIVSVAAGISFETLEKYFASEGKTMSPLFRVMPNTAIEIQSSMTFVAAHGATKEQYDLVVGIFNELGCALPIEEKMMGAATALASCGIAYALRYIRAATEGGVELGFRPREAQEIVARTVEGATRLLLSHGSHAEEEIDRVTTPGGVTIKGLNAMEEEGFTPAVIKGLRASR